MTLVFFDFGLLVGAQALTNCQGLELEGWVFGTWEFGS